MSRLYDITYNKDQWAIKGDRDSGYKLVNKESYDSFTIGGDVIGIEQITDDEFLIYRRIQRYRWQITRFKIEGCKAVRVFEEDFEHFDFLSDDVIMFDGARLYSIKKNAHFDSPLLFGNKVTVEKADGKKVLYIEHEIISTSLPNMYDLVVVDALTLKPISQAYSSLRDRLVTLSDDFTFKQFIQEDEYYARIIGDYLFYENLFLLNKGKSTLFSQVEAP